MTLHDITMRLIRGSETPAPSCMGGAGSAGRVPPSPVSGPDAATPAATPTSGVEAILDHNNRRWTERNGQ